MFWRSYWLVVSSKNTPLAEQLPQAFTGSRCQLATLMCFATWMCQMGCFKGGLINHNTFTINVFGMLLAM